MVKAVFKKKYFWEIICLLCGIFLISLFIFIAYKDSEATIGGILTGVIFGTIICLISIAFLLFNFKAYLYIENSRIKGKYNYFGKIDCDISDVDFVLSQINTLTIQLKNGKRHTIVGIDNSFAICSVIQRKMSFDNTKQPQNMIKNLKNMLSYRKKGVVNTCYSLLLAFIILLVIVFLIGEREVHEINGIGWAIIAVMGVIEIVMFIATFYFALKTGKNNISIEKLKYTIRRTIIETRPLLAGKIIRVYADNDYNARFTILSCPNENSVYYCVQWFDSDYNLINVYESDVFEDIELITSEFENYIDITEIVLR